MEKHIYKISPPTRKGKGGVGTTATKSRHKFTTIFYSSGGLSKKDNRIPFLLF
jgi:hypothetical protein